jgi:hypothetical protein
MHTEPPRKLPTLLPLPILIEFLRTLLSSILSRKNNVFTTFKPTSKTITEMPKVASPAPFQAVRVHTNATPSWSAIRKYILALFLLMRVSYCAAIEKGQMAFGGGII